jgi:hypothetical protein
VAANTTPPIDIPPWVRARYAAGGTMVSLGIGTIVLSRAMRAPMSQYPPSLKADRYQAENRSRSAVN